MGALSSASPVEPAHAAHTSDVPQKKAGPANASRHILDNCADAEGNLWFKLD